MKAQTEFLKSTEARLTIVADVKDLEVVKKHVFPEVARSLTVPGFRAGKVPVKLVEKHADPALLQSQFIEHAIDDLFPVAVRQANLRPTGQPAIELKKFVPFTALEFTATMPVIGKIKIADYKKIRKALPKVEITAKDVNEILEALRKRSATKSPVQRAAKSGDEVVINFKGTDTKGEPVNGAEGQDYPLTLGSNSFIPGFEDNLAGLKAGESKTFTLTFPKDYGVKALANRKVTFAVDVKQVQELTLPKIDDAFASSVGPVKTVAELKADIKKELKVERQRQANMDYESELVKELSSKSSIEIPDSLIDQEAERILDDFKQNLVYRGQTYEEFLRGQGTTDEAYRKKEVLPAARDRVQAGVVLAEIADQEKLAITPEELEARIQGLKAQYQDQQMQQELDKTENRRDIASRMLSEKTMALLAGYAQGK